MARRNPFDELQRSIERVSDLFEDATRRTEDRAEYASRQAEDATEYAGRQAGDVTERAGRQVGEATERLGSEVENTTRNLGTQLRSARSGFPLNDTDVNVADRNGELVVSADLPGFSKSEIDATLSGQTLRIEAERDESAADSDESYLRRERRRSSVRRSVALPGDVTGDDATASYQNGVLTVTIPKASGESAGQSLDIN